MARYVVTDSTSDLPFPFRKDDGIKIVPLNVHIHDKTFKDGVDLTNQEYYKRLRNESISPLTSQPSAGDFAEIFDSCADGDEIVAVLISSHLSGTVQSALLARETVLQKRDLKIEIIDSLSAAIGLGLQVIKCAEMIQADKTITEIKAELLRIQDKSRIFFVVDDLEYLYRGGRISNISKQIGNLLQLKPILTLVEGRIEVFDKVRTKQKALIQILKQAKEDVMQIERLAIIHIDNEEEASIMAGK
jgi:DegV family protein with EDD domain